MKSPISTVGTRDEIAPLLATCARGERGSLKTIYEREARTMIGVAARIVRRREVAERVRFQTAGLPAREDQLYEITLEPETGSPIGRPTGPILMKGLASAPRL